MNDRPRIHAWSTLTRAAAAAALLALAACEAAPIARGFSELETLTDARDAAERRAIEREPAPAEGGLPPATLGDARRDLAILAHENYLAAADPNLNAYNRMSALYRGAVAGWHAADGFRAAGEAAPADTPQKITTLSRNLCADLKERAPTRDCAFGMSAETLNALGVAQAGLVDLEAENVAEGGAAPTVEEDARQSLRHVSDMERNLEAALAAMPAGPLAAFMNAQARAYFCEANRSMLRVAAGLEAEGGIQARRPFIDWIAADAAENPQPATAPAAIAGLLPRTATGDGELASYGAYFRLHDHFRKALGMTQEKMRELYSLRSLNMARRKCADGV